MHSETKSGVNPLAFPVLGAMIGWTAFSGYWPLLAMSLLLIPLMQATETRIEAFLLCLAYYLAATRGLPAGISNYAESGPWLGLLLWGLGCSLNAACHAALWRKEPDARAASFMLSFILLAIPPLGITGWASPFTAAGVLFPGLGYWGLLGLVLFWLFIARRKWIAVALILTTVIYSNLMVKESSDDSWQGIESHVGAPYKDRAREYQRQIVQIASGAKGNVLFPESSVVGSTVFPTLVELGIISQRTGKTLAFGSVREEQSGGLRQVMIFVSARENLVYAQRQPVPLTMWKPFFKDSYQAGWFENPIVTVDSETYAPLLCYEAFLVWPVLHSAIYQPSRILLASNLWWAQGTSIAKIQGSIVHTWARLFGIPYSVAVNHA